MILLFCVYNIEKMCIDSTHDVARITLTVSLAVRPTEVSKVAMFIKLFREWVMAMNPFDRVSKTTQGKVSKIYS